MNKLLNRIKYELSFYVYKHYTMGDVLALIGILIMFTLFWYIALVTGIK